MDSTAGIPLVTLFDLTDRINSALPDDIRDFIERFVVVEYRSTRSSGAVFHHGKLQSLNAIFGSGAEVADIGIGELSIPLIHGGLKFQLSMARAPITGNLEPAAQSWQLDIFLADFTLTLDGLEPAIFVPETGTTARHLLRDPNLSKVKIIGSAVLRIEKTSPTANVDVKFVDQPDPFHPALTSGAVAELNISPPHFFLGSSEVGLSVGRIQFDFSESYSPPNVLEANQGPSWVGLAIREATVYAPRNLPVIGDLSGGVKNVLFGRPLGIQGEFELQFGRTALDPSTFRFRQEPDQPEIAPSGSGQERTVTLIGGQEDVVTFHAGFTAAAPPTDGSLPTGALQEWSANWVWPNGDEESGDSSSGAVQHGQTLRVTPVETVTVDSTPTAFEHPEVTFRFVAGGAAPSVRVTAGTDVFDNVVHLNGQVDHIVATTLTAISTAAGTSRFTWSIPSNNTTSVGADFTADFSGLSGQQFIVLKERVEGEDTDRITRIRVQLAEEGELLIGCENGVFLADDATTVLELSAVEATFDLSDFHGQGVFNPKLQQAELDSAVAARVTVPNDGLAQVTISDGVTAPNEYDRHVQVLMLFEEAVVTEWGEKRPVGSAAGADESDLQNQLLEWASHYPGADFLVIGRCDDIGDDVAGESPDPFNIDLAKNRAQKGRELLAALLPGSFGTVIDAARVYSRGETSDWDTGSALGDSLEENADISLDAAEKSEARSDSSLAEGWLIKHQHSEHTTWVNSWDTSQGYESTRRQFRRVDIYAVGGTPTDDAIVRTGQPERAPTLRRSMVPANDRTPAPVPTSAPAIDYRVKLRIVWDSPTVSEWKDAIPTIAEAEFAWTPQELPLPEVATPGGTEAAQLSKEVLTVYAQWVHDARTGFTKTTLGIRSDGDPEGLISTDQKQLTAAAAFGPMLLSGVDLENDVIGSGARMAALLAAVGFAGVDFGDGPLVGDGSQVAIISLEAEAQTRAISDPTEDYQIRLTTEYVTTIHVNGGVFGIRTADDQPMKIRYKDVGIEFDNSAEGWEKFGLAYDTNSMEIEDPGRWQIEGVLGSLLRIVEIAFGRGSLWIEARIAIAINIGVVEISEAIIRLTFIDGETLPEFELRGFVLKLDIPEVVEGEGRLRIENGGVIRAGVEASIIPMGLGATAGIAMGKPPEIDPSVFLELFLGVQFSTPLPLAQSGAAIYGFMGQFTMNGSRKLGTNPDPIGRELEWWAQPPGFKYEPDEGQYALGIGVVVGTMPDVSFCFSASGMVVVAFPDPEVLLGVDVKVIEVPDTTVSDEGAAEGTITGLIVIDDEAVKVAVSAQYTIPKVLDLKVPFGAYFPYSLQGTYVRIGSDGETAHGRFGEPITITLLPGTLDAQAWAYLMIEQDGLPSLGGNPDFSFEGFSVGFGAGWGIEWKAGPIKLSASGKVLVGFGTKPLLIKGGVFVEGELDLVVISISARGSLILTYFEENVFLEGEFCGEVDLFFFSLEGCVGVSIGSERDSSDIPPPEPPVVNVSLTDRRDRIMGEAKAGENVSLAAKPVFEIIEDAATGTATNSGASPADNNTVWPDTAPVLHFSHYIKNNLGSGGQFDADATPSQPIWFGSSRLKYTYRLDSLVLKRSRDDVLVAGDEALQSVWMTSPYRQPDSSAVDNPAPSEHEGPNLKLLDWNPWNWVVNMDDGGENTNGDPAEEVEDLCDPLPQPRRACVFGRAAVGAGLYAIRLRQETPAPPPYPSRFSLMGEPVLRTGGMKLSGRNLQAFINLMGLVFEPGRKVNLPFPVSISGESLDKGYRLPKVRRVLNGGLQEVAAPWEAYFDRELTRPIVTLMFCDVAGQVVDDGKRCTEFEGVKPDGDARQRFDHQGMRIAALDPEVPFFLRDQVDTGPNPDRPGSDDNADIAFMDAGIGIKFRKPCRQVELHFMKFHNAPITVQSIGPNGQIIDNTSINGPQSVPLVANLNSADGIAQIIIKGGGSEAVLYRICCLDAGGEQPEPEVNCEDFKGLKPRDRRVSKFTHGAYTFAAMRQRQNMTLVDEVNQKPRQPEPGQDGSAEVRFMSAGVVIIPEEQCNAVEIWVMLFNPEPVSILAYNAADKVVARVTSPGTQGLPHRLSLISLDGSLIARLEVTGGGNEAVIFRICCKDTPNHAVECLTFDGAFVPDNGISKFQHRGFTFVDMKGEARLFLKEAVDASATPAKPGADQIPDLMFADHGLRINLPNDCNEVRIRLMLFAGPVKAEARDQQGAAIDAADTTQQQRVEQVLTLHGAGIRNIELFGGSNEAFIYEICCIGVDGRPEAPAPGDIIFGGVPASGDIVFGDINANLRLHARATSLQPIVRGIVGDDIKDTWPGSVIHTRTQGGKTCRIVAFEPERGLAGPWNGFQVTAPAGQDVTVLSVCGTDQIMVDRQQEDQAARTARRNEIVSVIMTAAESRREILLEPGEDYELEIGWSYQAWESNEDGTNEPPSTPPDDWTPGDTQHFEFAIAEEQIDTGNTQDGLNEYVFDARDINRHLQLVEPADGRSVHFTDDPVWAHFDAGHIEQILEQYGRDIAIEIKRTDPPPQSTPAALTALLLPLTGTFIWLNSPPSLAPVGYQHINDAILDAPCLPDGPVAGGASIAGSFDLEPSAMYDFALIAAMSDGSDPAVVSATRFTTSRYAGPDELMADLGFNLTTVSPYRPDDIILPDGAVLPAGDMETSDTLMDELLLAMDADTLALPRTKPVNYAVWRQVGSHFELEGLLVDSLESLSRQAAVRVGTGSEITTRCEVQLARIGSTAMNVHRSNENWTRVFLKPASPVALAAGKHTLQLEFETSDGPVVGSCTISHVPSIVEREGF